MLYIFSFIKRGCIFIDKERFIIFEVEAQPSVLDMIKHEMCVTFFNFLTLIILIHSVCVPVERNPTGQNKPKPFGKR